MNRPRLGGMSNVTGTEKPHRSQPRHPGEIAEGHGDGNATVGWLSALGEYSGSVFRRGRRGHPVVVESKEGMGQGEGSTIWMKILRPAHSHWFTVAVPEEYLFWFSKIVI